jgi:hypothetical protein
MSGIGHRARRSICTLTMYVLEAQALSKGPALAERMPTATRFHHRLNDNRTFDLSVLFSNGGSGIEESQLAEFERNHICSNYSVGAANVVPAYRYPFNLIFERAKSEEWP